MGNDLSAQSVLTEFDALLTAGFAASTLLKMFRHDPLAIWAVIVIVINLPVFGRLFDGISMICSYFCHLPSLYFRGRSTRQSYAALNNSAIVHTWSVKPATIAGVAPFVGLMAAAEVIERDVQGHGRLQVFQFLTERIR